MTRRRYERLSRWLRACERTKFIEMSAGDATPRPRCSVAGAHLDELRSLACPQPPTETFIAPPGHFTSGLISACSYTWLVGLCPAHIHCRGHVVWPNSLSCPPRRSSAWAGGS